MHQTQKMATALFDTVYSAGQINRTVLKSLSWEATWKKKLFVQSVI